MWQHSFNMQLFTFPSDVIDLAVAECNDRQTTFLNQTFQLGKVLQTQDSSEVSKSVENKCLFFKYYSLTQWYPTWDKRTPKGR